MHPNELFKTKAFQNTNEYVFICPQSIRWISSFLSGLPIPLFFIALGNKMEKSNLEWVLLKCIYTNSIKICRKKSQDKKKDYLSYPAIKILRILSYRTSLIAQWIGDGLPMQETWVWSLVQEDPTCSRATKPMHHNYWAPCTLGPHAITAEAHTSCCCHCC